MDMVVELLMTGRSLPEVMMMVPEAWEKHQTMSDDKSLYEQCLHYGALGWFCFYSIYWKCN
jgi:glutamate synthase domain-containing protein 1